jgi:wyosine [tRNA(Phe)-imidazoG37] synthetase (radical SAM superfamily)
MQKKGPWLSLQRGIIYGPINSRRLGKSLGINLSPTTYKLCSFNCVYCQYGPTDKLFFDVNMEESLPTAQEVIEALENYIKRRCDFNFITFSGNGESTIHPEFPIIVREVLKLRDRYCPDKKIALLSNSSGVIRRDVREAINLIDLPILKLDAGDELTWRRVGRPHKGISFKSLIEGIKEIERRVIQTLFVKGEGMNAEENAFLLWMERLKEIEPIEVQIYSMDRPPADSRVKPVSPGELMRMAERATEYLGIPVKAYY